MTESWEESADYDATRRILSPDGFVVGYLYECHTCGARHQRGPLAIACDRGPVTDAREALSVDDWYDLAVRWTYYTLLAIKDGRSDEAGWRAKNTVTFCREYQLAGGDPARTR